MINIRAIRCREIRDLVCYWIYHWQHIESSTWNPSLMEMNPICAAWKLTWDLDCTFLHLCVLSVCLSVRLSVCPPMYLFVCCWNNSCEKKSYRKRAREREAILTGFAPWVIVKTEYSQIWSNISHRGLCNSVRNGMGGGHIPSKMFEKKKALSFSVMIWRGQYYKLNGMPVNWIIFCEHCVCYRLWRPILINLKMRT